MRENQEYVLPIARRTFSRAAHNRLGGMMWAVWPASCQAARRRLNLIESANWFPFRVAVVDATLFARSE